MEEVQVVNFINDPDPSLYDTEAKAIELAIKKWEFVVDSMSYDLRVCCGGTSTCALCLRYTEECLGCPISRIACISGCGATPFEHILLEEDSASLDLMWAKREVEMLKALVPDAQSQPRALALLKKWELIA